MASGWVKSKAGSDWVYLRSGPHKANDIPISVPGRSVRSHVRPFFFFFYNKQLIKYIVSCFIKCCNNVQILIFNIPTFNIRLLEVHCF